MSQFLQKKSVSNNHYREVLRVCLPLVISLSATTVMEFTDRIFLANYSIDAISAALPAGITSFLFMAFFGGIGSYAGVFIAQYTGRGDYGKIGAVLWQGIYFTLFSGIFLWILAHYGTEAIFRIANHSAPVQEMENIYFSILCKGAILHVAMATLATFFTGRGITRPVMMITFAAVFINIPLDYALIFGKWGMPQMGIEGAAIATVVAWGVNVLLLSLLIFTKKHNAEYGVYSNFHFNKKIFASLMRFGVPGSLQFSLDILGFTLFVLLVGRIGTAELAATNIVLSINSLAFMPSMGASQGMSVLVGQALGRGRADQATIYVRSGCKLLLGYIFIIDMLFIFAPDFVLAPFMSTVHDSATHLAVLSHCKMLLNIIAAYLFLDALYMIFSGALRGAGDTRFMMIAIGIASPLFMVLPVYLGIEYFEISIAGAWSWVLIFITSLFVISGLRYRSGVWKKMLVIEEG